MKILLRLIFLFVFAANANSQPAYKTYDHLYGGPHNEGPSKIIALNNGYLICGTSNKLAGNGIGFEKTDSSRGLTDYWIIRVDINGYKIWDRTFGSNRDDILRAAILLPDSGFLLGGNSNSDSGLDKSESFRGTITYDDFWIIRIDKNGNKIWDRTIGGDSDDELHSLLLLPDGGYLLSGFTSSSNSGDMSLSSHGSSDYWAVRTDSFGHKIWDRNYGGTDGEVCMAASMTDDSCIILAGGSSSLAGFEKSQSGCGNIDYWMLKIDLNGNKVWDKTFGGSSYDWLESMIVLKNNNIILGGTSLSPAGCDKTVPNHNGYDIWMVCTDKNGIKLWDNIFGGSGAENVVNSLSETPDGILVFTRSNSDSSFEKSESHLIPGSWDEGWILQIDSAGNKMWDKTLHCGSAVFDGMMTMDSCFVFLSNNQQSFEGSERTQYRSSNFDYWFIKFCPDPVMPTAAFVVNDSICPNSLIGLINTSQAGTSYQWFFPGATPDTSTLSNPHNINYSSAGTYDITLVTQNLLGSDTLLLPGCITVFPPIIFNPHVSHDTLFCQPGYPYYSWDWPFHYFSAGPTNYVVFNGSVVYTVTIKDSHGCYATQSINTNLIGIDEFANDKKINAYYNGNSIMAVSRTQGYYTAEITDVTANVIYRKDLFIETGENEIFNNARALSSGVYFVRLSNKELNTVFKVFIY